jgi:hypothetical protein
LGDLYGPTRSQPFPATFIPRRPKVPKVTPPGGRCDKVLRPPRGTFREGGHGVGLELLLTPWVQGGRAGLRSRNGVKVIHALGVGWSRGVGGGEGGYGYLHSGYRVWWGG